MTKNEAIKLLESGVKLTKVQKIEVAEAIKNNVTEPKTEEYKSSEPIPVPVEDDYYQSSEEYYDSSC